MLYVFTGSDTAKAKAEARKLAKSAEVVVFGEGGEAFERVPSYLGSRGLFVPEVALLIDRPLETTEGKVLIEEYGNALHEVSMPVFIIAGPITATDKKLFPKGAEFKEFETKTHEPERVNVFGITDVFLSGDRKKTWIEYQRLIQEGVPPEEIHGILSWAVRSALLSLKTTSAEDAGLKPFVYTKSKRAGKKLGREKVEYYSRELMRVYHRSRMGEGDLALNLESFLLKR